MKIDVIKEKLKQLKRMDSGFSIFGASKHQYLLNRPLRSERITKFEHDNNISLPPEYVQFLTQVGNGGAGPFYGVEPLENSLFLDLDYQRPGELLIPSKPFMHTSAWNKAFNPTVDQDEDEDEYEKQYEAFEDEYYDPKYIHGVIAICNCGCAVSINLVVNGPEYGNVWTDDRSSDYGIHPSEELGNKGRITFLDWYDKWLDNSIAQLTNE